MSPVSRTELLREVLAHPDELEPRLVFADWLQQNGEVERGELICIDCKLEDAEPWSDQQVALEKKRTELLRRYGSTWTAPKVVEGKLEFLEAAPGLCGEDLHHASPFVAGTVPPHLFVGCPGNAAHRRTVVPLEGQSGSPLNVVRLRWNKLRRLRNGE